MKTQIMMIRRIRKFLFKHDILCKYEYAIGQYSGLRGCLLLNNNNNDTKNTMLMYLFKLIKDNGFITLDNSFTWQESVEGHEFWWIKHSKLEEGLIELQLEK